MLKKLILVINHDIKPFGKVLNAIGHMIVGLSPRFPKNSRPILSIYSTNSATLRQFREKIYALQSAHSNEDVTYSDFAHTTTDGSAHDHASQTLAIKESDIQYYAATICADEDNLQSLSQLLADMTPVLSDQEAYWRKYAAPEFHFQTPIDYPTQPVFSDERKKFSIVLSDKMSLADAMYATTYASLMVGQSSDTSKLMLNAYPDADNTLHPGMSEYGLVVLKAKKKTALQDVRAAIEEGKMQGLDASCDLVLNENDLKAVALFGYTDQVNAYTKKNLSLWTVNDTELFRLYKPTNAASLLVTPPPPVDAESGVKCLLVE